MAWLGPESSGFSNDQLVLTGGALGTPTLGLPAAGASTDPFANLPPELQAAFQSWLTGQGGGGGSAQPWTSTQQGAQYAASQQLAQIKLQQKLQFDADYALAKLQGANAKELELMRQKFAQKQMEQELQFKRAEMFAEYAGKDPVRAVLLATGMQGGMIGGVGGQFTGLPAMKGAKAYEANTEKALGQITGQKIDITGKGVQGLNSVFQNARQAVQGTEATQTLLRSAFGVGSDALGGGISAEEFGKRVQSVTPTGVL